MKKTTTKPDDLLTTSEVAVELGITPSAALGLANRGRFPNARKLPGRTGTFLVPRSDVDSLKAVREARKLKRKSATSPETSD